MGFAAQAKHANMCMYVSDLDKYSSCSVSLDEDPVDIAQLMRLKSKSWYNTWGHTIIVWFGGGNRNRTSRTHILALGCQVLVHLAKGGRVEKKNISQEPRFISVASKVLASVVAVLVSWMIDLET
jgi:hypothetical protein